MGFMSSYLVSGATGFVGQEVIRQLLDQGHDVIAVCRRKPAAAKVRHIKADITESLKDQFPDLNADYMLHIASLPGDTGDPEQMVDVNVKGCLHMLEWAKAINVKHVVVASSISAYGWYPATKFRAPDYLPVDENHPCTPCDMYCVTKRMQELLCTTYFHQYNLPVTCLRLTAVIGPNGQGGGRGWRDIAEELQARKAVRIPHFSPQEKCHYVDIRDVARMLIAATQNENTCGEIFNCCSQNAVTGTEFEHVIHQFYPDIEVQCGFPWSMAQGGEIEFSMQKAKRIFGFEPKYSLIDSIAYIKQWIDVGGLDNEVDRTDTFTDGIKDT
jgi:nucleoside-diphosphate-sugar epimerase